MLYSGLEVYYKECSFVRQVGETLLVRLGQGSPCLVGTLPSQHLHVPTSWEALRTWLGLFTELPCLIQLLAVGD